MYILLLFSVDEDFVRRRPILLLVYSLLRIWRFYLLIIPQIACILIVQFKYELRRHTNSLYLYGAMFDINVGPYLLLL